MSTRAPLFALLFALAAPTARAEAPAPDAPITKLPRLVRPSEAAFPATALRDRVSGRVVLEVSIGVTGAVDAVAVVSSSTAAETPLPGEPARTSTVTDHGFAAAATRAALGLGFEPAESNGAPVPVVIEFAYDFRLPPRPPPAAPVAAGEPPPPPPRIERLRGIVRERGTRTLLPGVVVTVFRGEGASAVGFEATTDAAGAFTFFDLEPGEWRVLAEKPGYFPARTTEAVREGELVEATYFLESGADNPYAVVVEGQRLKKEVNRRTLSRAEIVRVPGTLGDPIQVIENLPGVARPPAFSGQILVRGSGPQDSGVYIDSIEVPLIYHFGGLRAVIPADIIESVDFWPGNYPVYYGRRSGGVYDARVKRLAPDQLHGSLDVSLLDAALYLEAPLTETLSIAVAGRRSYVDGVLALAVPDDAPVNVVSAPRYYDYQVIASWRPTPRDSVQVLFLGSDDELRFLFENPANASTAVRSGNLSLNSNFNRVIGTYRHSPGERYRNELKLAVGRDRASFRLGNQFRFVLDVTNVELRDQADLKLSEGLTLSAGIDANLAIGDVEALLPRAPQEGEPPRAGNPEDIVYARVEGQPFLEAAPFVEAVVDVGGGLTVVPGLRMDYFGVLDALTFDPRLVARYQASETWLAKAGVGLVHQPPLEQQTNAVFGNPDLGPQRALHVSAGAEWNPAPHLKLDATLFYKGLDNLVSPTNATIERDGEIVRQVYDNGGRGRVYGLELFLEHRFHRNFRGWVSYTLSRAERTDSGELAARLFDFDQTHILNVIASYLFPENFEVGLRWRLVSGNPDTPFVGAAFDVELDRYVPIPGQVNSDRLPLFHQLDLRIDKKWVYDAWSLAAYLSLVNTYNRANTEGFTYNFDYTQRRPIQGLPIFPILGIRGEF